ncbi:MAG: hypothetical protein CO095_09145, partial [Armatimonadetes bacterium CG_4_9_14_3_um_filter_58_7]
MRYRLAPLATLVYVAIVSGCKGDSGPPAARFSPLSKEMVSRAVESPPIIDAHLDDSAWQTSDVAGEFVNLQNENPQAMTVWVVCHDTRSLYLGVLCRDGELVTEMRERDQTASEDWMEVQ